MPSPFPGMNPYIEELYWPDFHSSYAYELKAQVKHKLPEGLSVHLEVTSITEELRLNDLKAYRPDVSVNQTGKGPLLEDSGDLTEEQPGNVIEILLPVVTEVKQRTLEIRDKMNNRLVAAVEILSPANKRQPNLEAYRRKRLDYRKRNVHFLELDLLRKGTRPFYRPDWPEATYTVQLFNAHWSSLKTWPLDLRDPLPSVTLPLLPEIAGIELDLMDTLGRVYANSDYEQIDVSQRPTGLRPTDRSFLDGLFRT